MTGDRQGARIKGIKRRGTFSGGNCQRCHVAGIVHPTYRWVQRYAPEIAKRLRWQWRGPRSTSWRVDDTYIKVRDKWAYLYRASTSTGTQQSQLPHEAA